jgi:hypothetical protein
MEAMEATMMRFAFFLFVSLLGATVRLVAEEGVERRGITSAVKLEEVIFGHLTELNGKYKMRATEVIFAPGGYLGVHHHVGLGFVTFFPASSHSQRVAGRRSIKLASTSLKREISRIPPRTKRMSRYAFYLWRCFLRIGQLPRSFRLQHNEPLVRFWHKANIARTVRNVRFRG